MTLDTTGFAFPKPSALEGKVTLSQKKRSAKLDELCRKQNNLCITCGKRMTREPERMNTATLGHDQPQPMGAKKRDNDDNLLGAQCFKCNAERGSKRHDGTRVL